MADPVVHFEMPVEDRQRVIRFYTKVFGWKAQQMGPEMGNYVVVQTGETDKAGMLKQPGMINGGFFTKDDTKPDQYPSVVIAVKDIQDSMQRVTQAGGEVLGEPMEIVGIGSYVSFRDTEGNRVGILQPLPRHKPKRKAKKSKSKRR